MKIPLPREEATGFTIHAPANKTLRLFIDLFPFNSEWRPNFTMQVHFLLRNFPMQDISRILEKRLNQTTIKLKFQPTLTSLQLRSEIPTNSKVKAIVLE